MPSLYAGNTGRKFELSSGGLPQAGGSGKLSPVLFSGGGGGYSAPRVDVHGADVRWTDMPVPQNVIDTKLESAAGLAQTWVDAAFDYQQRENKIISTNAVAEYDTYARQVYNGGVDADGNDVRGYNQSEGLEAKSGYMPLQQSLLKRRDEILQGIQPGARQMAALSMQNSYNNAMSKASGHRSSQMKVAEQNAKVNEGNNILQEYGVNPNRAWSMSVDHANSFNDMEQRDNVLIEHMSHALKTIQGQALAAGGPMAEMTAMKNMTDFLNTYKEDMPHTVAMEAQSELDVFSDKLKNAQDKRNKETLEYGRSVSEIQMPTELALIMAKGEAGLPAFQGITDRLNKLYPKKPGKAEDEAFKFYTAALDMQLAGNGSYQDGVDAWERIKVGIATGKIKSMGSGGLLDRIQKYVDGGLVSRAKNKNRDQNNKVYAAISIDIFAINSLEALDDKEQAVYEDRDMKKEYRDHATGVIKTRRRQLNGQIEAAEEQGWLSSYLTMLDKAEGGMTPEFEREVHKMEGIGDLNGKYSKKLFDIAKTFSDGKIPPEYKTLKASIKSTYDPKKMFYDPETGEVGFWNLQTRDRVQEIKQNTSRLANKSTVALRIMAEQSMMREARRWVNETGSSGRTYDQWLGEVFLQKESVKASATLALAAGVADLFIPVPGKAVFTEKVAATQQAARLYDWGGRQPGEAVEQATGVQAAPAAPTESPVSKFQPTTVEEKARLTLTNLHPNLQTRYNDKDTNFLSAMEFLRAGDRPNIDRLSDDQQEAAVRIILTTGKYSEWLKNL